MSETVIAGWIAGGCSIAAALITILVKRKPKKASTPLVKGTGNATSIVVSGSPSASPIAVGESINQTFTSTTNNIISHLAHDAEKKPSRPSPTEIDQTLRNAKPFDRLHIEHNYDGLNVSWPCSFNSISKSYDDQFTVFFNSIPPDDAVYRQVLISANIRIENYPKLKIIASGHRAWIEGRISKLGPINSICLDDNPTITIE
jgi:hypothetical protein